MKRIMAAWGILVLIISWSVVAGASSAPWYNVEKYIPQDIAIHDVHVDEIESQQLKVSKKANAGDEQALDMKSERVSAAEVLSDN